MTSCRGVATRRDTVPFEAGDKRKEPKSIQWGKVQEVEDGDSEGKDLTVTVELNSHEKSRGVAQYHATPHMPLFQPYICYPMLSLLTLGVQ